MGDTGVCRSNNAVETPTGTLNCATSRLFRGISPDTPSRTFLLARALCLLQRKRWGISPDVPSQEPATLTCACAVHSPIVYERSQLGICRNARESAETLSPRLIQLDLRQPMKHMLPMLSNKYESFPKRESDSKLRVTRST
jgi:hypothetical protein